MPAQVDPALYNKYSQYFDPSAFNIPAGAGQKTSDPNFLIKGLSLGDPVFGALFGGKDQSWAPYVDAQGNYVWTNPKTGNPVPVAGVPGASLKPSKEYRKMSQQIQAVVDLLPYYSRAVSGQIIPNAQAELAAKQATSPALAQLMVELYGKYGTQLNEVGNQINRTNALANVGTETAALGQARQTLLPEALAAAKQFDPEFFATRELAAGRLKDLLQSIDLGSGLSPVERREISQALAQEGGRRGTYGAPSNLETVGNALQYGQAGYERQKQNRSALSAAIANATAFLPSSRSGVDVFQVATGRPSTPNPGNAQFTGVNNVSGAANQSLALGTGIQGSQNQLQLAQMQIDANKKDWADYLNQVTSSIGNLASAAGGIAGLCWIARRVYGDDNPKWKEFRMWMITKAPKWFRDYYLANGERIAKKINSLNAIKIRALMDIILEKNYAN